MLGCSVPQGGQALLELALAQGKAACQRRAAVPAHSGHQGIGVGRAVGGIAAVQRLGIAGLLNIACRAGREQPDSRIVPVQDAHQCEQQLFRDVMSFYVGQFMGQHTFRTLEGFARRDEQDGMQRPRHHGAAHQRRGLHLRALALRQGVTPAFSHRLRVAAHANTPDGIAAELVQRHGGKAKLPREGRQVAPVCIDGKAFQHGAPASLQFRAGHDVMHRVVVGGGRAVGYVGGGLRGGFLRQGGHLGIKRLSADRHRRRGLGQKCPNRHEEQHRQHHPQAAEPPRAIPFLQLGGCSQQGQHHKAQQQALHQKGDEKRQEHGGPPFDSTVVEGWI